MSNKITYKKAYPSNDYDHYVQPPHNIEYWIKSMREIYANVNKGMSFNDSFNLITEKWDKVDKMDFKNWMSYYQRGDHLTYKKADDESNIPLNLRGLIPGMPSREPQFNQFEEENVAEQNAAATKAQEKNREEMEKAELNAQIKALIGRLNSAERIATTKGIDKVLGPVYENWMRALHDLKREIQVAPFRSIKSGLLEDLIIRKGNQLAAAGCSKSAKIMYKLAQVAPPPLEGGDLSATPTPPSSPLSDPNSPIPEDPNLPTSMPTPMPLDETKKEDDWAEEFLKGLSGLVDEKNDVQDIKDKNATLEVTEDDLVVYAQEAPVDITQPVVAPAVPTSALESALSNVTVEQVVEKLQAVSNIFKNREVSRQLAMVDIMLDQLGIAGYFSELGEATAKALESNQYCATRVEDILGRLKGSIVTPVEHEVDLEGEKPGAAEGNAVGLKNQLEQDDLKDKARQSAKQKAQNAQEDAAIANPQVVPAEVNTNELAQPTEVQAPVKPGVRV